MDELRTTQQINLYLPEFRPRNDWLSLPRVAQILGVALLVVAVLSGWDYWQRSSLQEELAVKEAELADQTRVTEQIERTLAGRATDQRLLSEISTRETNVSAMQQTIGVLQNVSLGSQTGFAEHLKNMSRASNEEMWLTNIEITEGGTQAYLTGFALQGAMVPNFIDQLGNGWVKSSGWRFSQFTGELVTDEEQGRNLYQFVLETR